MYFNPRLREGGDKFPILADTLKKGFQSTPPRRRRQLDSKAMYLLYHFNPRLREGGDIPIGSLSFNVSDFNPRLREGGDHYGVGWLPTQKISIHASAKEATSPYVEPFLTVNISIHASAKEATFQPCNFL